MVEAGKLSSGPPIEAWARSLRQESALQDQCRRAIHDDGGVRTVEFDRWNAARCLRDQFDSTRGVEYNRRLSKSRAITARFTRRSIMKDLEGKDLRNNDPCGGTPEDDASPTRDQALKGVGIDLSRVGALTSARTASRQALAPREGDNEIANNGCIVQQGTNTNTAAGSGRGKEGQGVSTPGSKGDHRGSMTAPMMGKHNSKQEVAVKKHELLWEKLKRLETLLSNEPPRPPPAEQHRENEKVAQQRESDSGVVNPEESAACVFDLSGGDDQYGAAASSFRDAPLHEMLATKCASDHREESQPNAKQEIRVAGSKSKHTGHEGRGRERGAQAGRVNKPITPEKARPKDVEGTEQSHLCKKALPNHRPCWWWAFVLPPIVEGICTPDTVFSAPTRVSCRCSITVAAETVSPNQNGKRKASPTSPRTASSAHTTANSPVGSPSHQPPRACSSSQHGQQGLLWAFSRAEGPVTDGSNSAEPTKPNPRGGAEAYERGKKVGFNNENRSPVQRVPAQYRLQTKAVDSNDILLCASRAICECGRRGGGGGGGSGGGGERGGEGPKLKLPLALLKIWGHASDDERRRKGIPGTCRGRRLKVVSLWTESEVLEALRDMTKGRWLPPDRRRNTNTSPFTTSGCETTIASKRVEEPAHPFGQFASDGDACCVQAFTRTEVFCSNKGEPKSHGGVVILNTPDDGEHGRRRRKRVPGTAATVDIGLTGPVFYRAAWRRTGTKHFVWKITSRYPYVSNLSAHFCPLTRAGSVAPFKAAEVEEGVFAAVIAKMEYLATVLRQAYDPTLQSLWADWAINVDDGQWFLIEVHGVRTDADIRNAAAARAVPPPFAEVESKLRRTSHRIARNHFCGDPDDLKARISAAYPTQEPPLVETCKRVMAVAESTCHPSRPPASSKVVERTKKALLAQSGEAAALEKNGRKFSGGGTRRMRHQYWRCAGDFCETHIGGRRRTSAAPTEDTRSCDKRATTSLLAPQPSQARKDRDLTMRRVGGTPEELSDCGGDGEGGIGKGCEEEDILGRRKHALSVETPRTVLFRLVLNARSALLGWRPSASDFSQMEKPVQLCLACYMVCSTIERERIETTRKAMEAEQEAARAGDSKRNHRPPSWKSRVQHELEESLSADRCVVSRLMDSFETAVVAAAAPGVEKKKISSLSSGRSNKRLQALSSKERASGKVKVARSGWGERSVVKWADKFPPSEVRQEEGREDGGRGESCHAKTDGVLDGARSTPPRKKATAAVAATSGKTSMVKATRHNKMAPSALGLTQSLSVYGEKGAKRSPAPGLDANRTQETEKEQHQRQQGRTKREVRARRKAKQRARRRLRTLAAYNVAGAEKRRKQSRREQGDTTMSGENEGEAESTTHDEMKVDLSHLSPLLQPTAPTSLLQRGVEQDGGISAVRMEGSEGRVGRKEGEMTRLAGGTGLFSDGDRKTCRGEAAQDTTTRARDVKQEEKLKATMSQALSVEASTRNANVGEQRERTLKPTAHGEDCRRKEDQQEGKEELSSIASGEREDSGYGEEDFEEDVGAEAQEGAPGWQRSSSEEVVCAMAAVVSDRANSEYGDEDFEDDAS